jgi:ABC-type uncharacterized transport system auxiliary subunit
MQARARRGLLAALAFAAPVAGCGDQKAPQLARADTAPLVALSHRIAAEGPCAQGRDIRKLQRTAALLVDAQRVPHSLEPTFVAGVQALADRAPPCVPAVPAISVPPPAPAPHGRDHGHGKHGHGRGGGGGD